jgi:RHS repeat-associated protein
MSYAGSSQFERFTAGGTTFTNNALGVGAETTGTSTTYYRRDNEGGLVSQRLPSTGNPIYYYAFDGLGSVSALTDSTGAAPALYSYEPYGETTASGSAPSTPNPWRYTSAYLDSTGFYKMGMRYYRPELMRWTQQDPLEQPTDPANSNRYGYVGGDPINSADPTGLVKRRGCTANASAAQCRRQRARRSSRAPRGVNQTVKDIATIACIPAGTHPIGAALCGYYAVLEVASN